jgi:predicted O-methyltransferase YrrM
MLQRLSYAYIVNKVFGTYLSFFVHPPAELYSIPGYVHPLEARFLYWLARRIQSGGLILEIGSFKGKSSAFLAAGLREGGRLVCVDTWCNDAMPYDAPSDVLPEFLANTRRFSDRIEIYRGRSSDVAARWVRSVDGLFIDGDHSYEACREDLRAWMPFVSPDGWIVFHDSGEPGVARAISEFFPTSHRSLGVYAWSIFAARRIVK